MRGGLCALLILLAGCSPVLGHMRRAEALHKRAIELHLVACRRAALTAINSGRAAVHERTPAARAAEAAAWDAMGEACAGVSP